MTKSAEIKARLDAATPGPWLPSPEKDGCGKVVVWGGFPICWMDKDLPDYEDTCDLIANAPTDIQHLLTRNAKLVEFLKACAESHCHCDEWQRDNDSAKAKCHTCKARAALKESE